MNHLLSRLFESFKFAEGDGTCADIERRTEVVVPDPYAIWPLSQGSAAVGAVATFRAGVRSAISPGMVGTALIEEAGCD